jgi:hypothetical protein
MKAKNAPDSWKLRLKPKSEKATADAEILHVLGDPAYLYEIKEHLSPWTRKQLDTAIKKLTKNNSITFYGENTKRLYATKREIPGDLSNISASAVRVLQHMPLAGGIEVCKIQEIMSEIRPTIDKLHDLGIVCRIVGSAHHILMLTAYGRRLRETLGFGLEIPPLSSKDLEAKPKWWALIEKLANNNDIPYEGNIDRGDRLIKHGYAKKIGKLLYITEEGREAYHNRLDLIEITRILEMGVHETQAHNKLAEVYEKRNRLGVSVNIAKTQAVDPDFFGPKKSPSKSKSSKSKENYSKKLHAYVLIRTDIASLGVGKARAQAMAAGSSMTHELYVKPLLKGEEVNEDVIKWHSQGAGFGTAVAIGARNEITLEVLKKTILAAQKKGFRAGLIVDDFYPYSVSDEVLRKIRPEIHTRPPQMYRKNGWRCYCKETTGGWIFGDKYELEEMLSHFSLTPHSDRERPWW